MGVARWTMDTGEGETVSCRINIVCIVAIHYHSRMFWPGSITASLQYVRPGRTYCQTASCQPTNPREARVNRISHDMSAQAYKSQLS